MKIIGSKIAELVQWLHNPDSVAVAVSGGIDSLTLATVAHRYYPQKTSMFHAISPAVPQKASDRVYEFAEKERWNLAVIDAKEFEDSDYVSNPVNRCFYCKQSLYKTIAAEASGLIVSGTNSDDLTDYRPGLIAAEQHNVRHPFAELGVDKKEIRNIARRLGFGSLSEIPASPCLSSRVETGIPVSPLVLAAIYEAEQFLKTKVYSSAIRCRYRKNGISVEVDEESITMLDPNRKMELLKDVEDIFKKHQISFKEVNLAPYRMGSAFLVRL